MIIMWGTPVYARIACPLQLSWTGRIILGTWDEPLVSHRSIPNSCNLVRIRGFAQLFGSVPNKIFALSPLCRSLSSPSSLILQTFNILVVVLKTSDSPKKSFVVSIRHSLNNIWQHPLGIWHWPMTVPVTILLAISTRPTLCSPWRIMHLFIVVCDAKAFHFLSCCQKSNLSIEDFADASID
jgi:hypothetical protein